MGRGWRHEPRCGRGVRSFAVVRPSRGDLSGWGHRGYRASTSPTGMTPPSAVNPWRPRRHQGRGAGGDHRAIDEAGNRDHPAGVPHHLSKIWRRMSRIWNASLSALTSVTVHRRTRAGGHADCQPFSVLPPGIDNPLTSTPQGRTITADRGVSRLDTPFACPAGGARGRGERARASEEPARNNGEEAG